jgi:hypothetical protein
VFFCKGEIHLCKSQVNTELLYAPLILYEITKMSDDGWRADSKSVNMMNIYHTLKVIYSLNL